MSDDPSPLNVVLLQEVSDISSLSNVNDLRDLRERFLQFSSTFTYAQSTKTTRGLVSSAFLTSLRAGSSRGKKEGKVKGKTSLSSSLRTLNATPKEPR